MVLVEEQTHSNKDLTGKEIKALSSVCTMFVRSSTKTMEIGTNDTKKKLYLDKQENIPQSALLVCEKLVNGLRKLCCDPDEESIAKFVAIRQL